MSLPPNPTSEEMRLIKDHEYFYEVRLQSNWLNWIFAITTFTITLSCLQFNTPWKPASLALIVILPMYIHAYKSIPESLKALRKLKSETNNPNIDAEIKYLEKKFHGWTSLVRHVIMYAALFLYFSVLLIHDAKWIIWLKE
jgi:hypothetical protein